MSRQDTAKSGWEDLARRGVVFERYDFPALKTDPRGVAILDTLRIDWFKEQLGQHPGRRAESVT